MRKMLVVTGALLALQACKSQKVLAVETEIAAAKARLATLEKRRQELDAESRRLQVERKTYGQQASEAALAKQRLVAAGLVLNGHPVPDGIQLDEALRSKSPGLGALAANIVQRQLPCLDPEEPGDTPEGDYGDCSVPEVPDACEGVAPRNSQSLRWSCEVAEGAIASAVCTAPAQLAVGSYPLELPTAHVEADVVRVAYEKNGRLVVADWPAPDRDFYEPPSWVELNSCEAENGHAQCVRSCDEKHGRLNGGCDDWEGGYDQHEGGDGDENPEPYELRAAREAAAREEAEAEEARGELAYQECLSGCGSDESEPELVTNVALKFVRSPAPGVYQFDVELEQDDGGVPPHAVLLSFPALHDELDGTPALEKGAPDTVLGLETTLEVQRLLEGPVVGGARVFAGLTLDGVPVGTRLALDGKQQPVTLQLDEVCDFGAAQQPTLLVEECATARAKREQARAAAAAKVAAAGPPDAGANNDAGVTP